VVLGGGPHQSFTDSRLGMERPHPSLAYLVFGGFSVSKITKASDGNLSLWGGSEGESYGYTPFSCEQIDQVCVEAFPWSLRLFRVGIMGWRINERVSTHGSRCAPLVLYELE